jgi:hypothetical protein
MTAAGAERAISIEFFLFVFERKRRGARCPTSSPPPSKKHQTQTAQLLVLGALFALSHPPSLPDVSSHAAPFSTSPNQQQQQQPHHHRSSAAADALGAQPSLAGADAPIEGHHKPTARDDVFAVIVDAGSTGSRVHVFRFGHGADGNTLELEDDTFEAVTPGLSSHAADPEAAAASLDPLLALALATVPADQHSRTTLTVGATAGLRLLPGKQADDILDAVRLRLREKYPFVVEPRNGVTVLDGQSEGAFAWLTLNYLLGHLGKPAGETVAAIDLGEFSGVLPAPPSPVPSFFFFFFFGPPPSRRGFSRQRALDSAQESSLQAPTHPLPPPSPPFSLGLLARNENEKKNKKKRKKQAEAPCSTPTPSPTPRPPPRPRRATSAPSQAAGSATPCTCTRTWDSG